jgi:ubiquinone biosynthesis protein UbiJ
MTPATTLAAALETALDTYLKQDPQALRRCTALEGKVIGLDITGLGLSLYFLPGSDGVQVSSHYEGDVDTRLTGSPFGFARLALVSREDTLFQGAVEIRGDTETGQQFQDLLAGTDWDWEEQLVTAATPWSRMSRNTSRKKHACCPLAAKSMTFCTTLMSCARMSTASMHGSSAC